MSNLERYFVSEEAEQAAKWKMVEELKRDKEHLIVIKKQMKDLGGLWSEFSHAIQNPDLHTFDVTTQTISVGKRDAQSSRSVVTELRESNVNWELMRRLLKDYQTTRDNINAMQKELNLPTPL